MACLYVKGQMPRRPIHDGTLLLGGYAAVKCSFDRMEQHRALESFYTCLTDHPKREPKQASSRGPPRLNRVTGGVKAKLKVKVWQKAGPACNVSLDFQDAQLGVPFDSALVWLECT